MCFAPVEGAASYDSGTTHDAPELGGRLLEVETTECRRWSEAPCLGPRIRTGAVAPEVESRLGKRTGRREPPHHRPPGPAGPSASPATVRPDWEKKVHFAKGGVVRKKGRATKVTVAFL